MKTPYEMMAGRSDNPLLKAVIGQEGKDEDETTGQDVQQINYQENETGINCGNQAQA
jgi:hypothetical protein